jgi:DNA-binding PadR family transcriptional regulator
MPKRKLDRFPSAAFQILLSLADDLHGHAIMRQVIGQTGGRIRLGPGTLYSLIRALLEGNLVEESAEQRIQSFIRNLAAFAG